MSPEALTDFINAPAREAKPARIYFHALAGMRGVAALFVLTFHIGPYVAPFSAPMGYAAVDLFFLLSGVVIEASYGDKLRGGMAFARFACVSVIRLYPLYILIPADGIGTGLAQLPTRAPVIYELIQNRIAFLEELVNQNG